MASNSKNSGPRSGKLEKEARESASGHYEAQAQTLREKTARLKELRLAREAEMPRVTKVVASRKATGKGPKKKAVGLADYLDGRQKSGHNG